MCRFIWKLPSLLPCAYMLVLIACFQDALWVYGFSIYSLHLRTECRCSVHWRTCASFGIKIPVWLPFPAYQCYTIFKTFCCPVKQMPCPELLWSTDAYSTWQYILTRGQLKRVLPVIQRKFQLYCCSLGSAFCLSHMFAMPLFLMSWSNFLFIVLVLNSF